MSNKVQILRTFNKVTSPPVAGIKEGELAVGFPDAAGASANQPALWISDGVGWRQANPPTTVTTQSITLGAAADIGAAYTAWAGTPGNSITGNVVIATFGVPAQAYVLTNPAAPQTAISWTSLGGSVSFASGAEIHAGTDTTKAINSAVLRGETLEAPSTGVANAVDHDKLIRLDGAGQIDPKFFKAVPSAVRGTIDPTAPPPVAPTGGAFKSGDMLFANKTGALDAGWTGATGNLKSGDMLLFDGVNWHVLPNETDLNAYVPLAGTALMAGSIAWAADQAGTDIIDGKNGSLKDVVIDCGTY